MASTDASRTLLCAFLSEALQAVAPDRVLPPTLPPARNGGLVVIAAGKAAAAMMRAALARADAPLRGLVVTRYGHLGEGAIGGPEIEVIEAGHPVPDGNSLRAAERALALAHELGGNDALLVLLSGGGSAVLASPAPGVSLAEKQAVTRGLLRSGARIAEVNCVRKHLSVIKGGRLALAAGSAPVTTWIISDVPGDDPSLVASGPSLPDPTTLAMAREIVAAYGVDAPANVLRALADPANETPDKDRLARGETRVIARGRDALTAAGRYARKRGYAISDLGDAVQGQAWQVGASHADLACALARAGGRRVILSGGETTVTVTNPQGRGGRGLEYLLGVAIALDGMAGISVLACDTDGIDGSGEAAGAIVTPDTLARARSIGLDPAEHLARNESCHFFAALGDLIVTGPTLTNVGDFRAIVVEGAEGE